MRVRMILSVLASLLVLSGQCSIPPPPAIGDIRLVPYNDSELRGYYEVQIYYTDGLIPADFGGVCADNSYEEESKVICHQMGYKYIDFHYRSTNTPLWFNHIQCDDSNSPHILRCKTRNVTSSARDNSGICGPENYRLLINCDFKHPLAPYDGQVALCPVDNTSVDIYSTSFGLIGIYYQDYIAWKGINQKREGRLLGAYEADTICRQMGFTGAYPGTAITRSVENYDFSNCFSGMGNIPPFKFKDGAWVTTDDIVCQEPQNCLGCCLQYPYRGDCGNCDTEQNLVIRCAFDPTKIKLSDGMAGSEDKCKLDSSKNVGQCATDNSQEEINRLKRVRTDLTIGVAVLSAFIGVSFCCLIVYCICKDKKCNNDRPNVNCLGLPIQCCRDYEQLEENIQNNEENVRINQNQNEPA